MKKKINKTTGAQPMQQSPPKKYTSREGCIVDEDGNTSDEGFHAAILDNPEADLACRKQSFEAAVSMGISPESAAKAYGLPYPSK